MQASELKNRTRTPQLPQLFDNVANLGKRRQPIAVAEASPLFFNHEPEPRASRNARLGRLPPSLDSKPAALARDIGTRPTPAPAGACVGPCGRLRRRFATCPPKRVALLRHIASLSRKRAFRATRKRSSLPSMRENPSGLPRTLMDNIGKSIEPFGAFSNDTD